MERLIFHVDVNSAFLSWEAAKRVKEGLPDLREIPSCIGGDPKLRRSIVVAKSIPAKKYGVTTGEPVALALRKCPDLVCVPGDFALYQRCSRAFKEICASYAPAMESFSIDEVFLDMTGTHLIYPDPVAVAHEIKDKIRDELGFTVNVGIGTNKLLAKMASDFEKPDKVHTLFPSEIPEKMWPLPVRDLLFLGKASEQRLLQEGIKTIGDMARSGEAEIRRILGEKAGHQLYRYANGIDDSPVRAEREEAKGYSAETTVEEDLVTYEQALALLLAQCDVVAARMRRDGKKCSCVAVTYRTLMEYLGKQGIDSVLLEGGGTLNDAALSAGIVNEICAFIAPKIFGGAGAKTPVSGIGVAHPAEAVMLTLRQVETIGDDLMLRYSAD